MEKRRARFGVVKLVGKAIRCAYLVKRSHITQIIVWPADASKCVIKSMERSSQT